MKTVPYKAFGKTRQVPLKVYVNGYQVEQEAYQETWWVERGEDWYALSSPKFRDIPVLVVDRKDWISAKDNEN